MPTFRNYKSTQPFTKHLIVIGIGLSLLFLLIVYSHGNSDNPEETLVRIKVDKEPQNNPTDDEISKLKTQINSLTNDLSDEREAIETLQDQIAELQKILQQKSDNIPTVTGNNKVAVVHKTLSESKSNQSEEHNFCSTKKFYSSKGDIQMLQAYEIIPFDNAKGGVWEQGFEITYDKQAILQEDKLQVFVVPHSHNDPGWWYTFEGYYSMYTNNILTFANKYLHEFNDMRFIYAEMSFLELWWKKHTEQDRTRMKELIQNGHLEVTTGAWVMTDEANSHLFSIVTEMMEGHEFVNNVVGYKPSTHWSIDPFGLSPTLAYLMKQSNISNLAIHRVHYSVKKFLAQTKDLEFKWRQLWAGDNSKTDVFTHMFPFSSYDVPKTCGPDPGVCCQFDFRRLGTNGCAEYNTAAESITDMNLEHKATILADQYRKKAQLYKTNVLLVPLGDDFRYPLESEWQNVRNNFAKLFPYINNQPGFNMEVKFGTLKDYFEASKLRQKDDIKIVSGDFFTYADRDDHYWSGYYTSRPFYKHMDRTVQHYVRTADILFSAWLWKHTSEGKSLEQFQGNKVYDLLVEARRHLSVFQHHDGVTGTAKNSVVVDYAKKMLTAITNCQKVIQEATFALNEISSDSGVVDAKFFEDKLPIRVVANDNNNLILFNPLPYSRKDIHCIFVNDLLLAVVTPDGNLVNQEIHPVINTDSVVITSPQDEFELCFEVEMPPFGFRSFKLEKQDELNNLVQVVSNVQLNLTDEFESKTLDTNARIELNNEKFSAFVDPKSGLLQSVSVEGLAETPIDLQFYTYGARDKLQNWTSSQANSVSGAYLFLPDGPAKPLESEKAQIIHLKGQLRQRVISKVAAKIHLVHSITLDVGDSFLQLKNNVDIRSTHNFELAMRMKTDIKGDDFFSDLNAYQMIRRRRFKDKLPIQAHFFPMPSAAFIEDDVKRVSLLGRQALGAASLEPGWLEVILDRRLSHDDDRGLQQSVEDNLKTESQFRLLIEPFIKGQKPKNESTIGFHSAASHHISLKMHSPVVSVFNTASQKPTSSQFSLLKSSLPCDVYSLAFRTMTGNSNYNRANENNKPELVSLPSPSAALVLQRFGVECGIESSLPEGTQCQHLKSSVFNLNDVFSMEPKAFKKSSLTMLYVTDNTDSVELEPMELKSDEFEKRFVYSPSNTTLKDKITKNTKKKFRTCSPWVFLKKIFPVFKWLPEYKIHYLSTDIMAGSTVAILNIPQAMAYAALAGVPAIIGLYTSFLPAILYTLFGTSKHVSLGMFAVLALMTANVEQRLRSDHSLSSTGFTGPLEDIESVQIIATLTFAVGLVLAVMALLQVHFVSAYLSDELIGGFTTGAAVHVMWSQIPKVFELKLPKRNGIFVLFKIIIDFFKNIEKTNYWALVISVCSMAFLYIGKTYLNPFIKRFCPIPVPLEFIVVVVTTILSNTLNFHKDHGVEVIGKIPTGFPLPALPKMSKLPDVFADAVVIAIVIYAVSFSVAKLFAKKHRYELDPAQEVRALSACQIFSSFMLCHPACASLSRSMLNSQLGVHSQISALVSSAFMLLLILWIGPLVEQLPMCVLASIILIALQNMLLQVTQLKPLWKTSKYDFLIWLVSFLGTVLWDVSEGLIIAIAFTLLTIVIRTQIPKAITLGQVDATEIFKNPQRFAHASESPFATIFRFEAPLLFVNCDRFKTQAMKSRSLNPSKSYFIIDAGAIVDLDRMGSNTLIELSNELGRSNVKVLIANSNEEFVDICKKCNVVEKIGKNNFFESVLDAVVSVSECSNGGSSASSVV